MEIQITNRITEAYANVCGRGVYATFIDGKFLHFGEATIEDVVNNQ